MRQLAMALIAVVWVAGCGGSAGSTTSDGTTSAGTTTAASTTEGTTTAGSTSEGSTSAGTTTSGTSSTTGSVPCLGGCPTDQVCNEGICTPIPSSCPCPKETYCDLGTNTCTVGCLSDTDCSTHRICDSDTRTCNDGCRQDSDCGSGAICQNLTCVAGCRQDSQCGSGTICQNLTCVTGCRQDAQCGSGNICESNACRAGCRSNSQCSNGAVCDPSTHVCRSGCRSNSDCPLGQICGGDLTCASGCNGDPRCPSGQICESGQCRTGCRTDTDCGSGQICESGPLTCRAGCRTDANCPLTQHCDTGTDTCVAGCNGDKTRCPDGQACVAYQDGSYRCNASYCSFNGGCQGSSYGCLTIYSSCSGTESSMCRLDCTSDTNCPSGDYCAPFAFDQGFQEGCGPADPSYFCARKCVNDSDCSATQEDVNASFAQPCVCAAGKCMSSASGGYACFAVSTSFGI